VLPAQLPVDGSLAIFMQIYDIGAVADILKAFDTGALDDFLAAFQACITAFIQYIMIYLHIDTAVPFPAFPAGLAQWRPVVEICIDPAQDSMKMQGITGIFDILERKAEAHGIFLKGFFDPALQRFSYLCAGIGNPFSLKLLFRSLKHITLAYFQGFTGSMGQPFKQRKYNLAAFFKVFFCLKGFIPIVLNRYEFICIFTALGAHGPDAGTSNQTAAARIIYLYHAIPFGYYCSEACPADAIGLCLTALLLLY